MLVTIWSRLAERTAPNEVITYNDVVNLVGSCLLRMRAASGIVQRRDGSLRLWSLGGGTGLQGVIHARA
jgi:hypothetical protein